MFKQRGAYTVPVLNGNIHAIHTSSPYFFHLTAHLGHHSPHSLGRWIEKVAFCQAWGWGGVAVQPITSTWCV